MLNLVYFSLLICINDCECIYVVNLNIMIVIIIVYRIQLSKFIPTHRDKNTTEYHFT